MLLKIPFGDSGLAMTPESWHLIALGLGLAFLVAIIFLATLKNSGIDLGFLGLMYLLTVLMFLAAFSFVVAAGTPGWSMKVAVTIVNGIFAFGSKLVGKQFLDYLTEDDD